MPESIKEAYEEQSAALKELQTQVKMIAERQSANMNWLKAQMEESAKRQYAVAVADGGSDDYHQQQGLDRTVQVEVHPSSSGDI